MKYILLIILLNISSLKAYSQSDCNHNTNFWSIEYGSKSTGNIENSVVFNWQSVQSPTTAQILGIYFIDSLHGWASHNNNGAMRTTDGGFNWSLSSFNDTNFTTGYNSVFFIDQNTGWCVGGAIQIRKTTNGGVNWFKQYGPPVAGIAHSVQFIDANTGYIAGSKNFPYVPFAAKTTNGGTNWIELNASYSGAQELNKEQWFDANTGWIAGYDVLLKTTNGGTNFTNYYSNVPPTGNGHNALLCINFVNQQTGWIGGSNLEKHNIYITTNAGLNWTFQTNPVSVNNAYAQINDITFLSPDSGWAIHGTPFSGAIMFTTNAGSNWIIEEGSSNWFQCVTYYQRQKAWCGASAGRVWYALLSPLTGIENNNQIPKTFSLEQNYPNPFNPSTKILFTIPGSSVAQTFLSVYDVLGKHVATLVNGQLKPGTYSVEWNANNYPSGVYFYKIEAEGFRDTKKMLLIK